MQHKKLKKQEAFYKYSVMGRIGMEEPPTYIELQEGPSLSIKLKPPRYPKNLKASKKVYLSTYLLRKLGSFWHIYHILENIYIVSLVDKDIDEVKSWIDKNKNKIEERLNEYRYTYDNNQL